MDEVYYKLNGKDCITTINWISDKYLLAGVLDAIEKNYPEIIEGENMGFFDLKINNEI